MVVEGEAEMVEVVAPVDQVYWGGVTIESEYNCWISDCDRARFQMPMSSIIPLKKKFGPNPFALVVLPKSIFVFEY